jgi:hypothetical protein
MSRLEQNYGVSPFPPVKSAHEFESFGVLLAFLGVVPLTGGLAIGGIVKAAKSGIDDDVIHGG